MYLYSGNAIRWPGQSPKPLFNLWQVSQGRWAGSPGEHEVAGVSRSDGAGVRLS